MIYCKTDADGTQGWYLDAQCTILHREDGPAVIKPNQYVEWYANGVLHRANGPAHIGLESGTPRFQAWYRHGVRHREVGPAVIDFGDCFWYQNGKFHRLNGPAIEFSSGEYEYWIEDQLIDKADYYRHPDVLKYRKEAMVGTVQFRYGSRVFDESPLYSGEALFGPEILARATRAMTLLRSPQDPRPEVLQLCERVFIPKAG